MASSLTIAPALGHSLITAQGMPGGYDAIDDRSFWSIGRQEGAVEAGAFEVTQRAAGANLSVDVACNTGHVIVQGDTVTNQGLYVVRSHTAAANLDIATAHATNPRVDSVIVQIEDDEHDSSGNTRAQVKVLTGTATSGATLDNRTGAASLPSSALLLADVHVPATDTTISNSQIRDRRKWALGVNFMVRKTDGDLTTTNTTLTAVHSTFLKRFESSGKPIRVTLLGRATHATADAFVGFNFAVDGSVTLSNGPSPLQRANTAGADAAGPVLAQIQFTPAAGSHTIEPFWNVSAGTGTLFASTTNGALVMIVEEVIRQDSVNNPTTSG